jgi:hypothetical protein
MGSVSALFCFFFGAHNYGRVAFLYKYLYISVHCTVVDFTAHNRAGPVFVDLLRSPGIDSQLAGRYEKPICRTGPPGYIGWRSRTLGIDSWAP